MDVSAAYREVGSYRGAAEICGTTHKTVKRIVERHNAEGNAPERKDRGHNYDAVRTVVAEQVERTKGRISVKRLLPMAVATGYEGSARNFRRLVADEKALWRKGNHRGRHRTTSASRRTTASGPTSVTPTTRNRKGSWSIWSAMPSAT